MTAPRSAALFAARCLVDELARAGVSEACVAPGSRSTPLALALAEHGSIRVHVLTDERSMGFFALGIARNDGKAVILACTSGTAAANFLPAVAEASLSGVPLIVLTADRPAELRDCAAPQTIDQVNLYGSHVRWAADVPTLEPGEDSARYYRSLAARAASVAQAAAAGPVHLNLPFREPFFDDTFEAGADSAPLLPAARSEDRPYTSVLTSPASLSDADACDLAAHLAQTERGVIVCAGAELPAAPIMDLARALGWPVLADPLSGLRYGTHDKSLLADGYEVVLRDETARARLAPQTVLRFGTTPASRSLQRFLSESWQGQHILIAENGWPDPFHACATIVRADPSATCAALAQRLPHATAARAGGEWTASWLQASHAARGALDSSLDEPGELFEGAVVRSVANALPPGATLFVGNSMPVRDADTFLGTLERPLRVLANRGASGIDGVLSTALGIAATSAAPTALVVGDLSFLHDASALQTAVRLRIPLLIVVTNNDGGAIFSFLPQRELGAAFEQLFVTPHGLDLGAVAHILGDRFRRAHTRDQLQTSLEHGLASLQDGPVVIEVPTVREQTVAVHARLVARAQQAAAPFRSQAA